MAEQNTGKTARGWSAAYPVEKRDAIQKILDPLLDLRVFSIAIFLLIIYSMYNLYESYQAQTPMELERLTRISTVISAIFMLEFVLKFASRRFAYLKREGIVDFLAASDFFSPAVRATKFVRFLRVLRLLRVVRGAKMVKRRASRIEENIFTTFSTATIVVMLAFVAVKSHYDWQTTKDRVHERLLPVLSSVEKQIAGGELSAAEVALADHPDFVNASHVPAGEKTPNWQLAAKREIDRERLTQVLREIQDQLAEPRWAEAPVGEYKFLEGRVVGSLKESPTPGILTRMKRDLYLRRHHAESGEVREALGDALVLLESVQVHLSRVETKRIESYLEELKAQHFPEVFLTIRHDTGSGTLTYRFLLDDEYIEGREDELTMLIATFVLIIMIVLVLNVALKDVIGPLGEMRAQTEEMAEAGELKPLSLSKRPDNEIGEIADHLNRITEK
jgi:hypothetical protein